MTLEGRASQDPGPRIKGCGTQGSRRASVGRKEVRREPRHSSHNLRPCSHMDPQMALPRALLLLLLLHLSPLGGRSHPTGGPGPATELFEVQDKVSEQQGEQMAPQPHEQDSGSVEDREAKRAASTVSLRPSDFQAQQRIQVTETMPRSSCFGHKMDRINARSRLGCNVVKD